VKLDSETNVGLTSAAVGSSAFVTGSACLANASRRVSVSRDSRRKVGKIVNAVASSSLRSAVVWKTVFALRISPLSWPWRSASALNTSPLLRRKPLNASESVSSSRSARVAWVANSGRLASVMLKSSPLPLKAAAWPCIHAWNAVRVGSSKARKISSSCTASETWARGRVPSSGSGSAWSEPGVSST